MVGAAEINESEVLKQRANEIFKSLGESKIMYLATSANDKVTLRAMSFIIYNHKFYFQTDKSFSKYEQIAQNSHVAVSIDNIQIQGICNEIGKPLAKKNDFFAKRYEQHFKASFEKYTHMENEVLFEIIPTEIKLWEYKSGKPYQEFLNFLDGTYRKIYYDCSK